MAKKLRQVGTVRFGGKAYGPSQAKELAKVLPKADLERLSNDPRFFRKTDVDVEEGEISIADQNDIEAIMDVNELRTLRRQTKKGEDQDRIDARIKSLSGE